MTQLAASAIFSPCRTWRYTLVRDAAPLTGNGTVAFIGLNPSTADETTDDPTIRRCIGFARRWDFAQLVMLNLYGYRATDPDDLFDYDGDRIGPDNDRHIQEVVDQADLVVCAWGTLGRQARVEPVLAMVPEPFCLGYTVFRAPRHPLYVRADTEFVPFEP